MSQLVADRVPRSIAGAAPLLLVAAVIVAAYWELFAGLVQQWAHDDNYSHGFLIVPLSAYFAWQRRAALAAAPLRPSTSGLVLIVISIGMIAIGTMAAEVFIARVSLVVLIAGSIAFLYGRQHLYLLRVPVLFLLLMIPLPAIVFNQIAFPLQLFASQVGEVTIRAAGVPVLRDGNVLELEALRLEVAEACSGIRSLVSLLTLAVVLGQVGGGSRRRRWLLALATIPIAVAANAGRVAGTGLAAHVWGKAVAEGFLHTASAALAFSVAVAALLALKSVRWPRWAQRGQGRNQTGPWPRCAQRALPHLVTLTRWQYLPKNKIQRVSVTGMIATGLRVRLLVIVALLCGARLVMAGREPSFTPLPEPLAGIPLQLDDWSGVEGPSFDAETLKVLGADEYLNRIYQHPVHAPVGLYAGYYGAQREGTAIHSPQNCLPGSGWVPVSHARTTLQVAGSQFPANRYVVEKRGERQLVLYWFEGRGRRVASEYVNKAYLLHDALRRGRTDGALVRIITPIADGEASADAAAQAFVRAIVPPLTRWLP